MTNYTLTAAPGSFSLTGNAATTFFGYKLLAAPGTFALAGSGANAVFGETLANTVNTSLTQGCVYAAGATVSDVVKITLTDTPAMIYGLTQAEHLTVSHLVQAAWSVAVTQGMTVAETVRAALGVVVLERLNISGVAAVQAKYGISLAELISINDALFRMLSGIITENIHVAPSAIVQYRAVGSIQEAMILSEALGNQLLMAVTVAENIALDDDQLLQAIYDGALDEILNITAGFVEPDGTFTTWAINTRTNAVSEYHNWTFNSFAKQGHKYLGANRDGLYELDGVDDDGASIPAYIRSGLFAPGGSRLSSFKAAYLGMRVDDNASDVFLKLITGDSKELVYRVRANDMRSTRVNFGKGLRSRYYAWELVTTGADFDLESVTFIPMVASRRVD